jgi:NitT/TauT family transport system substrate-binding protein
VPPAPRRVIKARQKWQKWEDDMTIRMTRLVRWCAAPAISWAVIVGTPAFAADLLRVGTPEASAFMFAILDVGIDAKIFEKHNIPVERIDFAGGGKLQEGMTAGAVDLSLTGNGEMAFIAKGAAEKAVAVTAGPPVDMAIIVRNDGSITKADDLKGKTFGVTSPTSLTSWLALAYSRNQGWGPDGIKRAYVGGMSSQVAGLLVKNVDAIVGPVEGAYILQSKGQAKIFSDFGGVKIFITHALYASNAVIKDHPQALRRFLAAWFETVRYVRAHKDETIRMIAAPTKLPPDIAAKIYDLETPALSSDGRFDPKAVQVAMESFLELGLLEKIPQNSKDIYTEEFLP